ncbi:glycoside hydrolase family 2 protein [Alloscardovia criceti]|uniref:glycoside hydrolase family 2 protein n=1 Tax=Alloscardovia criceti TaxID=356828 RepID=UPI00036AE2E0|nr:hypothetical protein [Alloscardovia criceti]
MTTVSDTFAALHQGWTVRALNPQAAPSEVRDALSQGIPATVPGEVTLDLHNAGLIDEPFDGDNENHQQWIGDIDWQYTCEFEWQPNGSTRYDLVAYGLDTVATLSLNGSVVGHANNYHRSYRWDIRPLLIEGMNVLEISFTSPVRETNRREQALGYYPHTEHHAFNQIRKPSYQFGWDWGIDVAAAGIWQAIGIDSWSEARIVSVRPLVDVLDDGTGVLNVSVDIEREGVGPGCVPSVDQARAHEQVVPVRVKLSDGGAQYEVETVIEAGRSTAELQLSIPNVKKWWPIGYGDQPLYAVSVEVAEGAATWSGKVGFRTVHVDTAADEVGRPFQIYVNNVPVHARGYNFVPVDAFMTRATRDVYAQRFADLVESNSNMVRAWGGSIYESEDFYELADELGIMVWQDFMLACAAYPEDPQTVAEIEAEAREQINRLSTHPSLVVWNGSNENYVAYSEWFGFKQALRDDDQPKNAYGYGEKGWGDYYYSDLIPELLEELDPTRVYLPSSPMSFTQYTSPNLDTDGTMHIWDAWNREDYRVYAQYTPRFADEFGYQAPPAWSTLTRVVHDATLDPFGEQMLVHQKASGGNYKLARGMRSHLTPGHLDDVSYNADGSRNWLIETDNWANIEDWHWACQLQQAQALRFGVEHMRSLEPINAGALIWQLNDDWPVVSWAAVDYDGHRKPLWHASRDFFAPRLATIQPRVSQKAWEDLSWEGKKPQADSLALVVLNDSPAAWKGSWLVQRMRLDGTILAEQRVDVEMEGVSHATYFLDNAVSQCEDAADEIIVATPQAQELGGVQDFARALYNAAEVIDQKLDKQPVTARIESEEGGYLLTIHAQHYARDLFCMVDKVDSSARIDGGMLSLLPGEEVQWHITAQGVEKPEAFLDPSVLRCANDLKRP